MKPTCIERWWAIRIGAVGSSAPYWLPHENGMLPKLFFNQADAMEHVIERHLSHATVHRVVIADLSAEQIEELLAQSETKYA